MPLLLGTKGTDILKWRASAELVESLEVQLARKWGRSSAREAESFLARFIETLEDELNYEAQFKGESSTLDQAIEEAGDLSQLRPLQARYRELVCAHFNRRRSVLALCDACNQLHDRLLSRALSLAGERMEQGGQGSAPLHAVLVSGDRGRGEETLYSENRYFLLYGKEAPGSSLFSRQLGRALSEAGLLSAGHMFWHGSLDEWRALLEGSFPLRQKAAPGSDLAPLPPFAAPVRPGPQEMPEWAWRLEALADLRFVRGEAPLADPALDAAAATIDQERNRGPFLQLARRVIGLPLAVGRFGGLRLQRTGEHRGEVNLEELALGPLVMTIRVLAVHAGIHAGGTVDRIKELLERGALDVELAERLLKAYQCLMQLKVLSEIRSEESGSFCSPEEFDEAEDARFRGSLEAVLNLQKIAYQRMVGQV
ncbi:MAG: nucleotidyltransferase [Geobacteraceae bacterium GWC2_58_44]|nr:MAG: nucleotidyltransferase [Geobacteraceae bacterium GWC2_58_44]HBG05431.1 nucleotidyltransferase [Geobacter sp.]